MSCFVLSDDGQTGGVEDTNDTISEDTYDDAHSHDLVASDDEAQMMSMLDT